VPIGIISLRSVNTEAFSETQLLLQLSQYMRSLKLSAASESFIEQYTEALHDSTSGLIYPALVGARKQSMINAEHLFSTQLVEFKKKKDYSEEVKYIETFCNWRRASDECSLSNLTCSKYNYSLLNMILDKLMPWHKRAQFCLSGC